MSAPLLQSRALYRDADPEGPLEPDDPRCVPLTRARHGDPFIALREGLDAAAEPRACFVTGQPGAGLSTELLRLQCSMERGASPWVVAVVSTRAFGAVAPPVDAIELHMLALLVTARRVAQVDGLPPITGIWTFSREVGAIEGNGPDAADDDVTTRRFLSDTEWRRRICFRLRGELSATLLAIRRERESLHARAAVLGRRGVVTIVDDIPALFAATSRLFDRAWEQAQRADGLPASSLEARRQEAALELSLRWFDEVQRVAMPGPMVWTTPVGLLLHPRTRASVQLLPYTADRAARAEVIRRRLPEATLRAMAATGEADAIVEAIVQWSLGCPRRLVEGVRRVIERSLRAPVTVTWLTSALQSADEDAFRAVDARALEWIARALPSDALQVAEGEVATASWLLARAAVVVEGGRPMRAYAHPALGHLLRLTTSVP